MARGRRTHPAARQPRVEPAAAAPPAPASPAAAPAPVPAAIPATGASVAPDSAPSSTPPSTEIERAAAAPPPAPAARPAGGSTGPAPSRGYARCRVQCVGAVGATGRTPEGRTLRIWTNGQVGDFLDTDIDSLPDHLVRI